MQEASYDEASRARYRARASRPGGSGPGGFDSGTRVIFLILTTHENLLEGTIFGNIPSIFLGLSTSFFVFMLNVPLTTLHLIGFYCYGLVLAAALVLSGMAVCSAIFGKERTMAALMPLPQDDKKDKKNS